MTQIQINVGVTERVAEWSPKIKKVTAGLDTVIKGNRTRKRTAEGHYLDVVIDQACWLADNPNDAAVARGQFRRFVKGCVEAGAFNKDKGERFATMVNKIVHGSKSLSGFIVRDEKTELADKGATLAAMVEAKALNQQQVDKYFAEATDGKAQNVKAMEKAYKGAFAEVYDSEKNNGAQANAHAKACFAKAQAVIQEMHGLTKTFTKKKATPKSAGKTRTKATPTKASPEALAAAQALTDIAQEATTN